MIEERLPDGDNADYWGLGTLVASVIIAIIFIGYETFAWLSGYDTETVIYGFVFIIVVIFGITFGPWLLGKAIIKAERTVKHYR